MDSFICANGAIVEVKLTQDVGWVTGRWDSYSGGRYYRVVHTSAAGNRVAAWYPEYEIAVLPPGDTRVPPGTPFEQATQPQPPGGGSDMPGGDVAPQS